MVMMMMNGQKAEEGMGKGVSKRDGVVQVILRLLSLAASVIAMSFMVTARQNGVASVYGFPLTIRSKWSYSYAFEYLVGVSAAAAAYSLLQLLLTGSRLLRKATVFSSKRQAWLIFAVDQIFAYAMMSAGSAAAGITNLNRTGVKHTALPNFCKALHSFCDHVAVSITFTFFGCLVLAASALQDVIWLSKC
ncbi:hypothetical protein WN944_021985 [Citrus x changshan-huyou]